MIRALYTAATGLSAQEMNIDVISNNLANVNTNGYKKSRAEFQDLIYQYIIEPGAQTSQNTNNPSGIQIGLGVETAGVQKIFEQGDLKQTGKDLDMAIEGSGFIAVTLPSGETAYTRSSSFQLDQTGNIVTSDGYQLVPAVTIPVDALSVSIAEDGTVSVTQAGSTAATQVGQITGTRFQNPGGLRAIGKSLFLETESSGSPATGNFDADGFGRLNQGFIETSNVSVVEEVVNMITAQRAYEANSKGIQSADEMMSQSLNLKR